MRILLINKFYYMSGGSERYIFEWERLLRAHGHEVVVFSMKHPRNRPSAHEEHFVDPISFDPDQPLTRKAALACLAVWSRDAARRLQALLDAIDPPDVAHLNSYLFQLTPSILKPLRRAGIPVVHSCHDYAQICVNQHLYDPCRGAICEDCLTRGPLSPVRRRCIKGSRGASIVGAAAGILNRRAVLGSRGIDRFVAFSRFARDKLIAGGIPGDRITHVPHFIETGSFQPADGPGEYALFFGRLTPFKGIRTFLDAAALEPGIPCKVLGGGELEEEVKARLSSDDLRHVEWLGHREGDDLRQTVRNARVVVVPSEWYEPFGLVILEAMAAARAVIASDIAGPSEIVTHGRDGLLFPPGDAQALTGAMERLWRNGGEAAAFGRAGRAKVIADYTPKLHYEGMMRVFEDVAR